MYMHENICMHMHVNMYNYKDMRMHMFNAETRMAGRGSKLQAPGCHAELAMRPRSAWSRAGEVGMPVPVVSTVR